MKPYVIISWCRAPSDTVDSFSKLEDILRFLESETFVGSLIRNNEGICEARSDGLALKKAHQNI